MGNTKAKVRLLLVDDEEDFLESTSRALERRGIEVQTALNGNLALNMVQKEDFDVVVLDLKMPGIDGIEVFQRLREQKSQLPVIMLTGHGSIDQAFQTSKQGIFDFIPKPCDPDQLAQRIHEAAESKTPAAVPQSGESTLGPVRVLIVDDEIELLDSLKNVLSRRKMEISIAQNGEEGLKILKNSIIDVVVLDIKMPGMDGIEVLKIIKKEYENVEVILLTGHPTISTALEGMRMGARQYIEKPPDIEELTTAINAANRQRLDNIAKKQQKTIDELRKRPD